MIVIYNKDPAKLQELVSWAGAHLEFEVSMNPFNHTTFDALIFQRNDAYIAHFHFVTCELNEVYFLHKCESTWLVT